MLFKEKKTKETRTYSFSKNARTIEVQLYIGEWEIDVTVINDEYYYKNDLKYYFPITVCNENKKYGAEIPIRKLKNDYKLNSGNELHNSKKRCLYPKH